eukprot:tig00000545_g1994.t1
MMTPPVYAIIAGPYLKRVPYDQTFTYDGSPSYDSAYPKTANLTYTWSLYPLDKPYGDPSLITRVGPLAGPLVPLTPAGAGGGIGAH